MRELCCGNLGWVLDSNRKVLLFQDQWKRIFILFELFRIMEVVKSMLCMNTYAMIRFVLFPKSKRSVPIAATDLARSHYYIS